MGIYINKLPNGEFLEPLGKKRKLLDAGIALQIPEPKSFDDIPKDKGLLWWANNGPFECIGCVYTESEFESFSADDSGREIAWLLADKQIIRNIADRDPYPNE